MWAWGFEQWKRVTRSPSKRFAAVMLAFVLGVAIGLLSTASTFISIGTACFIIFAALVGRRASRPVFLFLLLTVFLFGGFHALDTREAVEDTRQQQITGQALRVSGTVVREVERRSDRQRATLTDVSVGDTPVPGKTLVYLSPHYTVDYGDRLIFRCALAQPEPFDGFQYDQFLATQDIFTICYRPRDIDIVHTQTTSVTGTVLSIKKAVVNRLRDIMPEPHASFTAGLLFGGSSALSPSLQDAFAETGTSHILAASGFNVSLFSFVLLGWLVQTPLGRKWGVGVAGIGIFGYVIAAGLTPAVVRAGIMASLILVAYAVGRRVSIVNLFLVTLAVMLAHNPLLLFIDVGFQLSFVATAALFLLAPALEERFSFIPASFELRQSVAGSVAAIVLTLPIILWHFGSVSLVAPIANLLILPLIPYIMAFVLPVIALGFAVPQLASILIVPGWALSVFVLEIIVWFSTLPFAAVTPAHVRALAVVTTPFVFYWTVRMRRGTDRSLTSR